MLEEWQYTYLKNLSEIEGISISEALRRILSQYIGKNIPPPDRIKTIEGIGFDEEVSGRDHDRWLYGKVNNEK
jgi:hypothetical protein